MYTVEIDLSEFESMDEILGSLADALDFPDWFGMNLDALYDCLTEICSDTKIIVNGSDDPAFFPLLSVIRDADAVNEYLELVEN